MSSDPWERLQALSPSIHSSLTLRQLIPVQKSLIDAVLSNYQVYSNDCMDASTFELTVPLTETKNPQQFLMSLQYQLYGVVGLDRLIKVLLPLLQHASAGSQYSESKELQEAMLDAVFLDFIPNSTSILDDTSLLQNIPQIWACRIIARLNGICPVPKLLVHHILDGMTSPESLQPVTTWLLPILINSSYLEPISIVWKECVIRMEQIISSTTSPPTENSMLTSAVLCILLQSSSPFWNEGIVKEAETCLLWKFLSFLLHCGNEVIVKGGKFQHPDIAQSECLRRRGLYLLRTVLDCDARLATSTDSTMNQRMVWMKYLLCFETFEMEQEQHLIDQVWDTVAELCREASRTGKEYQEVIQTSPPMMSWSWIAALFSRLFLSEIPVLRKLVHFRFLNSRTGISIPASNETTEFIDPRKLALQRVPRKKHSIKSKADLIQGAPLSFVETEFVLDVIIPSFDTLAASIGTNMNYEENGRIKVQDLMPKFQEFLISYVSSLHESQLSKFIAGVLNSKTVLNLRPKFALQVLTATSQALHSETTKSPASITSKVLSNAVAALQVLFSSGSIIITYRIGLLEALARILERCHFHDAVDPNVVLRVLTLYPLDLSNVNGDPLNHPIYGALGGWISSLDSLNGKGWASTATAACAAAFVQLQILPRNQETWDCIASVDSERLMGSAIVLLACLSSPSEASSLLWPAINKGLSHIPSKELKWFNAEKATRSVILLEYGCRIQMLSGLGNGDLLVHRETQQMLPPPHQVEQLLSNVVGFLLNYIDVLISRQDCEDLDGVSSARCSITHKTSKMFALIIGQLKVFAESYPSSNAISNAVETLLYNSLTFIMYSKISDSMDIVAHTSIMYAALSCGAYLSISKLGISTSSCCAQMLELEYVGTGIPAKKLEEQTARSIFHYSRWGCLSLLLAKLLENGPNRENLPLLENLFLRARDLVEATPIDAIVPLFDSVRVSAASWSELNDDKSDSYSSHLETVIGILLAAMEDTSTSAHTTYMLNGLCSLLFRPHLLYEEYQRLEENSDYSAPIRNAFLRLMEIAGTFRSHILKAAVCHICAGWLGDGKDMPSGISAIPYMELITKLLVHKEVKIDESSVNQSELIGLLQDRALTLSIPENANASSVSRGFILAFFSRLPGPDEGLDFRVLAHLIHPIILKLLHNICYTPLKAGTCLMTGTEDYSIRIRSWQALCLLSRFATHEIADKVCDILFETFNQNLHGQIRYFMEVFTIQCSRMHPAIFGKRLVSEIQRTNLTLQQVSSLMVIAGNLIVGKYKIDFFRQFEIGDTKGNLTLHEILSGVIPWLSSTQGFSRAIAQLLVYELIPLVVKFREDGSRDVDDNWYLQNLYRFLDQNSEMKRLRNKQLRAFNGYDVDLTCTVEGLFSSKVDESDEADPEHVIDLVKKCLADVYLDAHEHEAPQWKQVEQMLVSSQNTVPPIHDPESLDNFQRKIVPLDALNLAIEESREQRLRNASGKKRQNLIICATLIDKVPNLGGLARTAEIFAADRLVIPDLNVVRMDNFKSISVGAGDWINIEECKEDVSATMNSFE
jgi:hypothetical protein